MSTKVFDASEFQSINWAKVVDPGIIRAHNGHRADRQFAKNLIGARAHCPWRGFYQYLPASVDPRLAARLFQATTGLLLPGEVAILDLEEGSGDQRARRNAWLDALHDEHEWTYSGLSFARDHLSGVKIDWIAAYRSQEPSEFHRLWQFTDHQVFAGIAGPCDGSIFGGTLADLIALTSPVIPPKPPVTPPVIPVPPKPPKPPMPPKPAVLKLAINGKLDIVTIKRWQQVMGTVVDGRISTPKSSLIVAVQTFLKRTAIDGDLGPNTIAALQSHLRTPVDGKISVPTSTMVAALQRALNAATTRSKKF